MLPGKNNFHKSFQKFFRQKADPHFVKELEKKLHDKARDRFWFPQPRRTIFSRMNLGKFSVMAAAVFLLTLLTIKMSFFSRQQNHPKGEDIIDRAYAANQLEPNQDGIFYQKMLEENSSERKDGLRRKFSVEMWTDPQENGLSLKRNLDNGKILNGHLTKKENGRTRSYILSDIFHPLEQPFGDLKSKISENFKGFIYGTIHDKKLAAFLVQLQTVNGLMIDIIDNTEASLTFQISSNIRKPSRPLFKIIVDKKNALLKARDISTALALTPADYQRIQTLLQTDLYENKEFALMLAEEEALFADQYHCVERAENAFQKLQQILQISSSDRSAVTIYSSEDPRNTGSKTLQTPTTPDHDFHDIVRLKVPSENVKQILDKLKINKAIKYEEKKENNILYYVFSIQERELTHHYYFDAETYHLKKEQIIFPPDSPGAAPVTLTISYLESRYIDKSQAATIFEPDQYGFYPVRKREKWKAKTEMVNGCYDPADRLLSPEQKESLLKSIPPAFLEQYKTSINTLRQQNTSASPAKSKDTVQSFHVTPNLNTSVKNLDLSLINPVKGTNLTHAFKPHHLGIDLAPGKNYPNDLPVVAAGDGTVIEIHGGEYNGGYGNSVLIDHGRGIQTHYTHLNNIQILPGQTVKQGQQIGIVGNSGRTMGRRGYVLHFELIHDGQKLNPLPYFTKESLAEFGY